MTWFMLPFSQANALHNQDTYNGLSIGMKTLLNLNLNQSINLSAIKMDNRLVETLYKNPKVWQSVRRFASGNTKELIHECIIILMQSPEKVKDIINIDAYFIRLCWNQWIGERTTYNKSMRNLPGCIYNDFHKDVDSLEDKYIPLEDFDIEDIKVKLEQHAKRLVEHPKDRTDWFNKEMLKLYVKTKNIKEIERKTQISYQVCYRAIQEAIKTIKNDLRDINS